MLTHKFGRKLEERKAERSGIVQVSSIAADIPGPMTAIVYGVSKVFVKYLT